MKSRPSSGAVVFVAASEFSAETVKHAVLSVTDEAYAALEPADAGIRVVLRPKRADADVAALRARFDRALSDETLRAALEDRNLDLRDHIVALALRGEAPPPAAPVEEPGLTPEQEAELDRLVAEVEAELGREPRAAEADPQGVTRTWEETRESEDAGGP